MLVLGGVFSNGDGAGEIWFYNLRAHRVADDAPTATAVVVVFELEISAVGSERLDEDKTRIGQTKGFPDKSMDVVRWGQEDTPVNETDRGCARGDQRNQNEGAPYSHFVRQQRENESWSGFSTGVDAVRRCHARTVADPRSKARVCGVNIAEAN